MDQTNTKTRLSLPQAANLAGVTRQAIYVAGRKNRLKMSKGEDGKWYVNRGDLLEYQATKYSSIDGKLLYDNKKGFYSVRQAADLLEVPIQRIYYLIREGRMKAFQKKSHWVICFKAIQDYAAGQVNAAEIAADLG